MRGVVAVIEIPVVGGTPLTTSTSSGFSPTWYAGFKFRRPIVGTVGCGITALLERFR
jgi:hypothetical protein